LLAPAVAQEFNVRSQTRSVAGGSRESIRVTFNEEVMNSEENLAKVTVSHMRRRQVSGCGYGGNFTQISRIARGNQVIFRPRRSGRWKTKRFVVVTVPTNFHSTDGSAFRGGPAGISIGCADTNTYDGYTRLK